MRNSRVIICRERGLHHHNRSSTQFPYHRQIGWRSYEASHWFSVSVTLCFWLIFLFILLCTFQFQAIYAIRSECHGMQIISSFPRIYVSVNEICPKFAFRIISLLVRRVRKKCVASNKQSMHKQRMEPAQERSGKRHIMHLKYEIRKSYQ